MQDMMGGFFGLELPEFNNFPFVESTNCALLNSGRSALACILDNMPRPRRIFIPRFSCDTLREPLTNIPTTYYGCDETLTPLLPEDAGDDDCIILINYFGLTGKQLLTAAEQFPGQVIADATTALFWKAPEDIPVFYSLRKFVGVPDGGIACAPFPLTVLPEHTALSADSALHLLQRLESGIEKAASAAQKSEDSLCEKRLRMSPLTKKLLPSINFERAARQRLENYGTLHRVLAELNRLPLPVIPDSAPMCYPFVCGIPGLRDDLIDAGIALPLYWPEVIDSTDSESAENKLTRTLLPLPLDQRYDRNDMQHLLRLILLP